MVSLKLNLGEHLQEILFMLGILDNIFLFTLVVPVWTVGHPNCFDCNEKWSTGNEFGQRYNPSCKMKSGFFLMATNILCQVTILYF